MIVTTSRRSPVRLHLTNVAGTGASKLLQSLMPALERVADVVVERIELPDRVLLADYSSCSTNAVVEVYRRRLPNALSRLLECIWLVRRFDGDSPLLVLGDLPLRCRGPQTVFLQQSNFLKRKWADWRPSRRKYALGRVIFQSNLDRVDRLHRADRRDARSPRAQLSRRGREDLRDCTAGTDLAAAQRAEASGPGVCSWTIAGPDLSGRRLSPQEPCAVVPSRFPRQLAGRAACPDSGRRRMYHIGLVTHIIHFGLALFLVLYSLESLKPPSIKILDIVSNF